MFKIAACDDEQAVLVELEQIIEKVCKEIFMDIYVETFSSGTALWHEIKHNGGRYDLIFLDIEMEDMNGIQLSKLIRDDLRDQMTDITFISGKKDYAMELFQVRQPNF